MKAAERLLRYQRLVSPDAKVVRLLEAAVRREERRCKRDPRLAMG